MSRPQDERVQQESGTALRPFKGGSKTARQRLADAAHVLSVGPFDLGRRGRSVLADDQSGPGRLLIDRSGGPLAMQGAALVALLTIVGPASPEERAVGLGIAVATFVAGLLLLIWGAALPPRALDLAIPTVAALIVVAALRGGDLVVAAAPLSVLVATAFFAQRPWRVGLFAVGCLGAGYAVILARHDLGPAPLSRWLIVMTAMVAAGVFVHWVRDRVLSLVEAEQVARERAEEGARRLAELSSAKSAFLERMSHELRTPLNAVLGFTSILRRETVGPLTSMQAGYLADVQAAGDHLLALVDDALDVGRVEAGEAELVLAPVSISAAIEETVRFTRERARRGGVQVTTELMSHLPIVVADGRKIRQALLNLVANAVRFTPPGGRVVIGARASGDQVVIWVQDTGIGIDPRDTERMFGRFEQASVTRDGTGLGLPLSRRFVEQHGGRIDVESTVGRGSTFSIVLPVRPPRAGGSDGASPRGLSTAVDVEDSEIHDALMRRGSEPNRRLIVGLGRSMSLLAAGLALVLAAITPGGFAVRVAVGLAAIAALAVMRALPTIAIRGGDIGLTALSPLGAVMIAVLVVLTGSFSDVTALAFGWVIVVAFAPWAPGSSSVQIAFIALCYAVALAVEPSAGSDIDRWVAIVGVFTLQGLVVRSLVGKLQLMIVAEREARRSAEEIERELTAATGHKDDFVASMSHELRTPLNAIVGFSEIVLAGSVGRLNPEQEEYLAAVQLAGRQLLTLIEDILQLAKLDAGRLRLDLAATDPSDIAERAASTNRSAADKHVELMTKTVGRPRPLVADRQLLEHALVRLVAKALSAAPPGSPVLLEVRERSDGVVFCVTGAQVRGAPLTGRDVLFETADEWDERDGSGLTFAVVRRIAMLHAGDLIVTNGRDDTVVCELVLPIRTETACPRELAT